MLLVTGPTPGLHSELGGISPCFISAHRMPPSLAFRHYLDHQKSQGLTQALRACHVNPQGSHIWWFPKKGHPPSSISIEFSLINHQLLGYLDGFGNPHIMTSPRGTWMGGQQNRPWMTIQGAWEVGEEMLAKARRSSTSSSVGPAPSGLRGTTPHGTLVLLIWERIGDESKLKPKQKKWPSDQVTTDFVEYSPPNDWG